MPLQRATCLSEIATTCTPEPLDGQQLEAFFVETDEARDEKTHLRKRLAHIFSQTDRTRRVLLYGHRGCGKSTELNCFKRSLDAKWLVVDFSIQKYLPPVGLKAEDILLAIAVAIVDKLADPDAPAGEERPKIQLADKYLERVVDFFSEVTEYKKEHRDSKLGAAAEVGAGGGLWAQILPLKAKLSTELTFGSRTEKSGVSRIRQRPGDLIAAVNGLLQAVDDALGAHGRRLLLIVENLDKIQLAEANDIFVHNHLLLSKLVANIIYTIPIFTFYTPDREVIQAAFDAHLHLQMIKPFSRSGEKADGYAKIEEIILKRVDRSVIDPDALALLIRGTGGVLRHVFEALQEVSSYANLRDGRIHKKNIRDALNSLRINIGTAIGWPLEKDGSQKKPDDLYETLAQAAKVQTEGGTYQPKNDQAVHILLRSGALIEYNGERWLGVHPLAWEYLRRLGYPVGDNPYGI